LIKVLPRHHLVVTFWINNLPAKSGPGDKYETEAHGSGQRSQHRIAIAYLVSRVPL
jgi:hypothetical protein